MARDRDVIRDVFAVWLGFRVVISTRRELRDYNSADLRMSGVPAGWRCRYRLTRRPIYFQRILRRAEFLSGQRTWTARLWLPVLKVRLILLGERIGIAIPCGVFGPGLSIAHGGAIVVNGGARVGARCRIHQGVTLGSTAAGAPTLGDDVFLGPNSVVIGAVTIGTGVTIGAGCVVTKDFPPNVTVAGVPARVIQTDTPPWHQRLFIVARPPGYSPREACDRDGVS
jgi:serine O-acetyltransferase